MGQERKLTDAKLLMPIAIPPSIAARLAEIEATQEPIDTYELSIQLARLVESAVLSFDERLGCQAEILGLRFVPVWGDDRGPWNSYFGPFFSGQGEDGKIVHVPDAKAVGSEIIEYWKNRSEQTFHPVLKARYADLAWEIGQIWNREHRANDRIDLPRDLAQRAIDAHLASIDNGLSHSEPQAWEFLDRALELALHIHDTNRVKHAKYAAFEQSRRQSAAGESGSWWRLDNMMWDRKGLDLTADERAEIISWLDEALEIHSDIYNEKYFDPHQAQMAADRLRRWHDKLGHPERGISVIKKAGAAFEAIATKTNALTATAWLQDLSARYRHARLMEDAARVDATIKARSQEVEASMTRHEVKIEVPQDKMDQWLDALLKDSLEMSLGRIAVHMMTNEDRLRQMVEDSAANAPLHAHIPMSIMGESGFTRATIGSIKDDMPGRMLNMAATLIGHSAPWLHIALDRTKTRWALDTDRLLCWLSQSPLFPSSSNALLKEGIDAWFSEDHVKSVHLLIPQAEAALREWLSTLGESPMEEDRHAGGFKVIGMGDVLHKKSFKKQVHPTLIHHLRAFYVDPKGLNLRNRIAHGLASPEILNCGTANWVIHSLIAIRTFAHLKK